MRNFIVIVFLNISLLTGCAGNGLAPFEVFKNNRVFNGQYYIVQPQDTLYSIAFKTGQDYLFLAKINNIKPPYSIYPGQKVLFKVTRLGVKKASHTKYKLVKKPNVKQVNIVKGPVNTPLKTSSIPKSSIRWIWPVKGNIIHHYNDALHKKGIDITGPLGTPIKASASGTVVYSGNALKDYGNLIILKHDESFLSAYAHNQVLKVKEGDKVTQGQEIALMGQTGSDRTKLHFEIRYKGKPVDPIKFLP
ncbi:MAG: hypothetical protein JWM09_579 [Francisellaceae bacterium]|nr:hypothetical protein [Francisellaceae bacterium]